MIKRLRWVMLPAVILLSACQASTMTNDIPMRLTAQQAFSDDHDGGNESHDGLFSALIHQESGGRNKVVSHAGAVGRAQLMIPTARLMARKLGMRRVARLSRYKLRRLLMNNPALSEKLGRAYLNEGIDRYGRRDLALIYYNGGPRAADAAYRSLKRNGHMKIYTGETYCYVKKIAKRSGITTAPMRLIKGRTYWRNRKKWLRRTGRAPCRA